MPEDSAFIVVDAERGFSELCPDELPGAGSVSNRSGRLTGFSPCPGNVKSPRWTRIPRTTVPSRKWAGRTIVTASRIPTGARFLPELKQEEFQAIFRKGFRHRQGCLFGIC